MDKINFHDVTLILFRVSPSDVCLIQRYVCLCVLPSFAWFFVWFFQVYIIFVCLTLTLSISFCIVTDSNNPLLLIFCIFYSPFMNIFSQWFRHHFCPLFGRIYLDFFPPSNHFPTVYVVGYIFLAPWFYYSVVGGRFNDMNFCATKLGLGIFGGIDGGYICGGVIRVVSLSSTFMNIVNCATYTFMGLSSPIIVEPPQFLFLWTK